MSVKPNFDTHQAFVSLTRAGFDDQQANQLIDVLKDSQSDLATKSDVKEIMLLLKGLYIAGIFGFAMLGWACSKIVEILDKLP